jgi:hypothetical protein
VGRLSSRRDVRRVTGAAAAADGRRATGGARPAARDGRRELRAVHRFALHTYTHLPWSAAMDRTYGITWADA